MNIAAPQVQPDLFGQGSPLADLAPKDLREIVEDSLSTIEPGAKVLAIVPDRTRDDNTDLIFPIAARFLGSRKVHSLDALIAQGTHPPMTAAEKRSKLGIGDGDAIEAIGRVFDHRWSAPEELVQIGELSAVRVTELTGGLLRDPIPLTVNRRLGPGQYDHLLIFGATVPHEVAGFAGGAKYLFPGVAGPELTHATHWLGALAGIENTIGRVETPTRHLIEAAADQVTAKITCYTSVVTRSDQGPLHTHALFAGDFRASLRAAAGVSEKVHIRFTGRKYRRVVALLDPHYEDLWLGGKASYKLGGIIEDAGELIIYAPRLRCLSETHGELIERHGYAVIERVQELVAGSSELASNLCVAAHLAHVSFAARKNESGEPVPRYRITLASQIDEATCTKVNLGFLDHRKFRLEDYQADPDTLIVNQAGRDLYLPQ